MKQIGEIWIDNDNVDYVRLKVDVTPFTDDYCKNTYEIWCDMNVNNEKEKRKFIFQCK